MRRTQTSRLRRALTWALLSGVVLPLGLVALAAAMIGVGYLRTGSFPGELQWNAWLAVLRTVLVQALAPQWGDNSGFGFGVDMEVNP